MPLQEAIKIDSTVLGFAEKQVNLITNLKVYPQLLFDIYIEPFTNSKKLILHRTKSFYISFTEAYDMFSSCTRTNRKERIYCELRFLL